MSEPDDTRRRADLTGSDDAVVTRSEEELHVTTRRRETRRARLTRFIETETVTRTVEVRHEQVRVEYDLVTDGDRSDGPADGPGVEDGRWTVLYDEEVVLTTRRVPRERVRLRTHSVTGEREISEVLRQERVEVLEPAPRAADDLSRPQTASTGNSDQRRIDD